MANTDTLLGDHFARPDAHRAAQGGRSHPANAARQTHPSRPQDSRCHRDKALRAFQRPVDTQATPYREVTFAKLELQRAGH